MISSSSASPRRCHDGGVHGSHENAVLRLGRRERAEVVLALHVCAASASGSSSKGLGSHQLRRARTATASGAARSGTDSSALERRAARGSPRPTSSASTTATSSGSSALSAPAVRSTGGPPSTVTETTCPRACTPVSVRPATASSSQRGNTFRERLTDLALDRPQPRLAPPSRGSRVPSYSSVSLSFRSATSWIMMTACRSTQKYDLYSEDFRARTLATFARRCASRIRCCCQPGIDGETPIWFLTRYDDVVAMLVDDERFVRDPALALDAGGARPDARRGCRRPDLLVHREPHAEQGRRRPPSTATSRHEGVHAADGRAAAAADPGDRRRAGRPRCRSVGRWSSSRTFAFPLPITVIAELLGIPVADQQPLP